MTTSRLFVAVYPPAEAVTDLGPVADGLHSAKSRPMPPAHWHLTLAFIGPADKALLTPISSALATTAEHSPPIHLRITGGDTFHREGRAHVLWAALEGDTGPLTTLAETVRARLKTHGIPTDERPLKPHLTLARPGHSVSEEELAADLATLRAYRGPRWTVEDIALVESRGDSGAVRYEVLGRWRVGG